MKCISTCRACGSSALSPAFSIDATYDVKSSSSRRSQTAPRFSTAKGGSKTIDYVVCDPTIDANACGLLQRAAVTPQSDPDFRPRSGVHRSTRNLLRGIATEALELLSGRDCAALDIGCNDGTLLSYYPRWVERFGVDSHNVVNDIGVWATTLRSSFPSRETEEAFKARKFDIITAISVLEDLAEPRPFFASAKSMLAPDGVMVVETLYAPLLLTRAYGEPIYNRHAAIYSLAALERLFRDCGFKIFRGLLTDKNGGSIRLFLCHEGFEEFDFDPWYERLARFWDEENTLGLRLASPYQAFEQRVAVGWAALEQVLGDIAHGGEVIHIIGTGPMAAEIYGAAGAARHAIEAFIAYDETLSVDRLCQGGPLVISEQEALAMEPDCLVAPLSQKRDVLERWREAILRGAKVVFPGARPHVVTSSNYAVEFGKTIASGDGAVGPETLRSVLSVMGGPQLVLDGGKLANAS
ncbi:MAG: class I SAM-dependent methyltransferase [Pseudomonadota bacterium]